MGEVYCVWNVRFRNLSPPHEIFLQNLWSSIIIWLDRRSVFYSFTYQFIASKFSFIRRYFTYVHNVRTKFQMYICSAIIYKYIACEIYKWLDFFNCSTQTIDWLIDWLKFQNVLFSKFNFSAVANSNLCNVYFHHLETSKRAESSHMEWHFAYQLYVREC